jgi:hypothetical protein
MSLGSFNAMTTVKYSGKKIKIIAITIKNIVIGHETFSFAFVLMRRYELSVIILYPPSFGVQKAAGMTRLRL